MNDSRQKRSVRQKTTSKASLFLMEMMIGIVFFAIAATGCVQVFARAHLFSQEAENLQMAQSLAAEAVEELRADTELWRSLAGVGETAAQESSARDALTQADNGDTTGTTQHSQEETGAGISAEEQTVLAWDYDESWELCEDTAEAEYHLTANASVEETTTNVMYDSEEEVADLGESAEDPEGKTAESAEEDETESNDTQDDEETRQDVRLGHIRVLVTDSDGTELFALETDQSIPYTLADAETER